MKQPNILLFFRLNDLHNSRLIIYKQAMLAHMVDELSKHRVVAQQFRVARQHQLFLGTCQRHVQLAVDDMIVFNKAVGGEKVELIQAMNGERIDNDVALRALITFNGVDAHLAQ